MKEKEDITLLHKNALFRMSELGRINEDLVDKNKDLHNELDEIKNTLLKVLKRMGVLEDNYFIMNANKCDAPFKKKRELVDFSNKKLEEFSIDEVSLPLKIYIGKCSRCGSKTMVPRSIMDCDDIVCLDCVGRYEEGIIIYFSDIEFLFYNAFNSLSK